MEQMELVESLREKTGCSYSEAKAAAEASGGDLLEALCWLEGHGKSTLVGASCSTEDTGEPQPESGASDGKSGRNSPLRDGLRSLWDGLAEILRRCNRTDLVMTSKTGHRELAVPLTLVIILLFVAFWVVLGLMVIALFFGNRFSVQGALGYDDVNDVLGKATDFAEDIKDSWKDDNHG